MTIVDLNLTDCAQFVEAIGWVFEGSPWVAARAWQNRPFANVNALHAAMVAEVAAATTGEQISLLRAHPDLGARVAMSRASIGEQKTARLDALTDDDRDRLRALNTAYRDRFGFPFVYAVKGSTKKDILDALERRLREEPEVEQNEVLQQVYRIARFRLEEFVE
jgi:OHCU decarboxylase